MTTTSSSGSPEEVLQPLKHSILLERLRVRHLKESVKTTAQEPKKVKFESLGNKSENGEKEEARRGKKKNEVLASSFEELELTQEVMGALEEMGISAPTEIQCIGIPAVLGGNSVVLGSHTGSGKTLAYMLPIVQVRVLLFFVFQSCTIRFLEFSLLEDYGEELNWLFIVLNYLEGTAIVKFNWLCLHILLKIFVKILLKKS